MGPSVVKHSTVQFADGAVPGNIFILCHTLGRFIGYSFVCGEWLYRLYCMWTSVIHCSVITPSLLLH